MEEGRAPIVAAGLGPEYWLNYHLSLKIIGVGSIAM